MEQLEQILAEGNQAIIFSQFTTYLDMIQHFVHEKHWKFSRIDGTQSTKRRQIEVDDFQASKTSIFLISLKAGGVGLNLTAASYVFVMDPWWNPAVENQATDRAFRIGQKNNVLVHKFVCRGTAEEKIHAMITDKIQLATDVLSDDGETRLTELDDNALLDLVSLDLEKTQL